MTEYILDETWTNTPHHLTSNLLLLQRLDETWKKLTPQSVFVWVGNENDDDDDDDGFYVGDLYYIHPNSKQGWMEQRRPPNNDSPPNEKEPSGELIRVRLIYSKPPSILLNNHQRILDTVTALKRQIGGCVWGGGETTPT